MTYEEKKAWLSRYREAERVYQRLSYQLAEAQAMARRTTQQIHAAPGGNSDGQSLARAVEREEAAERRCSEQQAICDKLFSEIHDALAQVQNNRSYVVLHKYYLNCLTWEQVATQTNLSLRWVYALHRLTVKELEL